MTEGAKRMKLKQLKKIEKKLNAALAVVEEGIQGNDAAMSVLAAKWAKSLQEIKGDIAAMKSIKKHSIKNKREKDMMLKRSGIVENNGVRVYETSGGKTFNL